MINCLLIDDDEMSQKVLKMMISNFTKWNLIGCCSKVADALIYLEKKNIDVLFLDVEMPEISGLEFLEATHETPEVVMVSSKEKYAVNAFEHEVTDYLVKPFSSQRFLKTVDRIESKIAGDAASYIEDDGVFVKSNGLMIRIRLKDILWLEAYGDYVNMNTESGTFIIHSTMKGLEVKMPKDQFARVHRSFIVRIDKINSIEDTLILIRKKLIPIGESYKVDFINRLKFL